MVWMTDSEGVSVAIPRMSVTPACFRVVAVTAVIDSGTDCRFCSRFWAVTTTSSSVADLSLAASDAASAAVAGARDRQVAQKSRALIPFTFPPFVSHLAHACSTLLIGARPPGRFPIDDTGFSFHDS